MEEEEEKRGQHRIRVGHRETMGVSLIVSPFLTWDPVGISVTLTRRRVRV